MTRIIDTVRDRLLLATQTDARAISGALTLGFWDATGREMAVGVDEFGDTLRLSDRGEAWAALASDGLVPFRPKTKHRKQLARVAENYHLNLNIESVAFEALTSIEASAVVARRIMAAQAALDGWRVWLQPSKRDVFDERREIIECLTHIASKQGWIATKEHAAIGRSGYVWPLTAELVRREAKRSRAAVVHISRDDPAELAKFAIGWQADVERPLVLVARQRAADALGRYRLPSIHCLVEGPPDEVSARVVDAVERFAA